MKFVNKKLRRLERCFHTLAQIEIEKLETCGIKGIILDLDNTVISE